MAQIIIGEGLWSTIAGYLNSMFTEIYNALSALSGSTGNTSKLALQTTITGGQVNTINTSLSSEPYSVMILDQDGNIITHTLSIKIWLSEPLNAYMIDIYSEETLVNVKIKITY